MHCMLSANGVSIYTCLACPQKQMFSPDFLSPIVKYRAGMVTFFGVKLIAFHKILSTTVVLNLWFCICFGLLLPKISGNLEAASSYSGS